MLLLRQAHRVLGLTAWVASRLYDGPQRGKVEHGFAALLRQRVFGLALGYEDVNDHAAVRHDHALQTAADRDRALASRSTLSRFENAAQRRKKSLRAPSIQPNGPKSRPPHGLMKYPG